MHTNPENDGSGTTTSGEDIRFARSALFVPGDRPDRFTKAVASGTDLVVCDLEDAVAAPQKDLARTSVTDWLRSGARACVRVNPAESPDHAADVQALVGVPGVVAVLLAKAEDPAAVRATAEALEAPVIALIETALGLSRAAELAAVPGVARLGFGHLDYSVDIGAEGTHTAMLSARSAVVLASRLGGLTGPFDGVTAQFNDDGALAADAAHARELGFTGKFLIHPRQVAGTHAAFAPTPEQVDWAREVVRAAESGGAVQVDGAMVDAPVVAQAQAILLRHNR
ncbi:HpcH/HpaI aldolase/citrate lyase family protein [Ornithinimicrobium cavernae]|uniref:HpcH/HpaI aldolase/citrate lyase family protein n=1 Tax=Ornithinimicrobium cavernae TaxID=2666047 RepID=UPI000D6898CD|nr:CoA ester lyase [Ornithinimicrobium cavernae]